MSLPQAPSKAFIVEYVGATVTPAFSGLAFWCQVIGAGTIVLVNEDGSTVTLVCSGGEIFQGAFKSVTSSTATRIRLGNGPAPQLGVGQVGPTNLAGGAASLSGVLPAGSKQDYLDGGTAATAAFTAAIATNHKISVTGATFAITLPAISSANAGQKIAITNIGTGTTATVVQGTGADSIGNTAATGVTAAGPTGGAVKVYTADNTLKAWLVGI